MKIKKYRFCIITLLVFLLAGCRNIKNNENYNIEIKESENDEFLIDDDLLHRIYETGVKVPENSMLIIDKLDLDLDINKDENIKIYVVDLQNSINKGLGYYSEGEYISCIVDKEGVYSLIGIVNDRAKIDLTPQVVIQTEVNEELDIFLD